MGSANSSAATQSAPSAARGGLPLITVTRRFRNPQLSLRASSRLVAVVIADAMGPETKGPEKGRQTTYLSEAQVASRSGLSERTVRKCLKELDALQEPFFYRKRGGVTRGRKHRCYRFVMIESVSAFTSAAREREAAAQEREAASQRDRLAALLHDKQPSRQRDEQAVRDRNELDPVFALLKDE